jgi:DNA-directed RNA polymerase specialized sigma24 family protein
MTEFDEELHTATCVSPETLVIAVNNRERPTRALESLPPRQRELIVLREPEDDQEIATITSTRRQLQLALTSPAPEKATHGL